MAIADTKYSDAPIWPGEAGGTVVLIDVASGFERQLIETWIEGQAQGSADILRLTPSRRRLPGERTDPALAARLRRGDNPTVFAVRVAWLPPERQGNRTARWVDVLKLGDPRDPDPIRQRVIHRKDPTRAQLVVGDAATADELLHAHSNSVEVQGFTEFVTMRAHRTLDRSERQLRGNRYKVPKLVPEEILARADFRDGVMQIASETGMPIELAFARSRYYLREIAASHSPFLIDLIANAIHWVYRQGYGAILYEQSQLASIKQLCEDSPIAFVPSHRSNLDRLSLQYLLWENDLPPNHTAAGINMNFFPIGPLIRRTGAFFIRRSFKDKPLYKFVLRSYLGYLIEKRFALEWYMEGGRSRTGKLLPPKYGMLSWVVEALQRGKSDDFFLIPTSIAYDQIQDVASYAAEAQGAAKQAESFGWALSAIRSLRQRYGNIHIRFGEPISVADELGPGFSTQDHSIEKLAFEVMYQIGQITPITPTAVVSIALLWGQGRAATADTLTDRTRRIAAYIDHAQLPTTEPIRLAGSEDVCRVLEQLTEHDSVTVVAGTDPTEYRLDGSQALQAAYYRNTIVHFFVPGAIAELSILVAAETGGESLDIADQLRDLLKFEFFFSDRQRFRDEVGSEIERIIVGKGRAAEDKLKAASLLRSHWALLPFLDAYQVVADRLLAEDGSVSDTKAFLRKCLELGLDRQSVDPEWSPDGVSQVLYASGLEVARHRNLLEADTVGRAQFADLVKQFRSACVTVARLA